MRLADGPAHRTARPSDAELSARFVPVFERIAAGAAARERGGGRLHAEVGWLRDAGFTALRVPRPLGGLGAGLGQLIDLLTHLAAAEPDLLLSLRWHLSFVEDRLGDGDDPVARQWLHRIGAGLVVGRAVSELAGAGPAGSGTTLRGDGAGRLRLNGKKHAGTGSLYAGAVAVSAVDDDGERVVVVVPAARAGVELVDGRAGIRPREGAGGTAVLADVVVQPDEILPVAPGGGGPATAAFVQLVRLAGLAGIARRAADDAAELVRGRRPAAGPGMTDPSYVDPAREDPLVLQVVGKADAAAFAARAAVRAATSSLEAALDARAAGRPDAATLLPAAEADVNRAQVGIVDLVLRATTDLLGVGGSSAADGVPAFDRHWRRARTLALRNPVDATQRVVGDYLLNGRGDRDGAPPLRSPFPAVRSVTSTPPEAPTSA